MKKNVVLLLLGLLLGCGAGAVATEKLSAQMPGPPMNAGGPQAVGVRWQQFCEQAGSVEDASQRAGARGMEGFELLALYNGVMCFKRPWAGAMPGGAAPGTMNPMPVGPAPNPSNWPGY